MGEVDDASTPLSHAEPHLKAAKDKNCPFCGQAFTSSSLGRHLDLYIRAKNPKAADGIHVVDEIRKLRGGITRRQAKGSVSGLKQDDGGTSTPLNKKQRVASEASSGPRESPADEDDEEDLQVGKARGQFTDVSWGKSRQPSRTGGTKTPDMRRDMSRQLQKAGLGQRQKHSEEAETASATELALRELLKSVRDAHAKTSGPALFDFDPYTLTFPSLCLHILPAPSTLFAPAPFPTADSWSVQSPGPKQFDALNKQVRERLLAQQRQKHINSVYPAATHSNASSTTSSPLPTPPLFDNDPQKLFCHIADSYNHWMHQTDKVRQEYWQIEILRCYARADDRRREAEVQLEHARREIEHLKANRWASGPCDMSPITIHLGTDTAKELGKHGMDFRNWDYDRLVEKWRGLIRENRASTSGMPAQRALPAAQAPRSLSMASLPANPFITASQKLQGSPVKAETAPFTAPPTIMSDANSDQLDAEGDDEDLDLDQNTPSSETMMHQPQQMMQHQQQHHMPLQPTPIHPSQQMQAHIGMQNPMQLTPAQAQAHLQAQANAQAQAQAWAAARQHMSQSRNQNFSPHHQQMSPHVQHVQSHMGSANSSRRPSVQFTDMNGGAVTGLSGPMGMATGMEGIEGHEDGFLRIDMSMSAGFVGGGA